MKFFSLISMFLCTNVFVKGFVVPVSLHHDKNPNAVAVALHPDQAKELEACAFDLTRDYIQNHMRRRQRQGPMSWYSRLWAEGFYPRNDEEPRMTISNSKKK